MATLLQIAQLGQPVLRQKPKPIKNIKDPKVQTLIDDLIATVKEVNGVGIATPQVYQPFRVFIVASRLNARHPKVPVMAPTAIINPQIVSHSEVIEKDWEGCLSIPGVRALVPRFQSVHVQYLNRKGKLVRKTFNHFIARIFQHELDHLDGIMFLDRLETNADIISEKEYLKLFTKKRTVKKRG